MDLVAGAIIRIGPKLLELLKAEYELQKSLQKQVQFLSDELVSVHGALCKVAEVPWDQLDEQVKIWAGEIREASYDMEDVLDTFLVRAEGHGPPEKGRLKRALKKMGGLFSKGKARHDIAGAIEDIKKQLQEVAERRARCKVDDIVAKPAAASSMDPRLKAMHTKVSQLIGIDKSSDKLSSMIYQEGIDSNGKTKIVSVVGVGGLGKTTLAKAVYDELKPRFDCRAFVPVGRNPDMKKVFRDILIGLDKTEYMNVKYNILDEWQLINELQDFLESKRYFIVIDDVWEVESWEKIQLALVDNDKGSRVIKTTRKSEVATGDVYKLQPLSYKDSKMLLHTRIYGSEGKCPTNHPDEASEKILQKCGGIPLAIITMASFLVGKSGEDWFDVCNAPGFYRGKDSKQVDDTVWILSLSYYDLPSELKTCLLYLSVYPEDYEIHKDSLIWKWIAEGFIKEKTGTSLFQQGEEYFNQLINRSMIQAVGSEQTGFIYSCRVHDMVLDLIRDLSYELNFVTISNDDEGTQSLGKKVRRLAYQNRMMKQTQQDDEKNATVRSFVACRCDIDSWVLHPSFKLLRVLELEGCRVVSRGCWQGLKHLGNLLHLRYLCIGGMPGYYQLPEEIGNLKFLQILELGSSCQGVLPSGFCQLTQLLCLRGSPKTHAPDGLLAKLTSLEVLEINIDNLSDESMRQFMKDLGNLSQARELGIYGTLNEMVQSELEQSLGKLQKLQHLQHYSGTRESVEWSTQLVLSRHLQSLDLQSICFHRLPLWISPALLPRLCILFLFVDNLDDAGLRALGGLPELSWLHLRTDQPPIAPSTATVANITAGDGFFQKLRYCNLDGWMVQLAGNTEDSTAGVSFTIWNGKGAMPFAFGYRTTDADKHSSRWSAAPAVMSNLQELRFKVPVRALYKDGNGSCDNLGLEFLPSLRKVYVYVDCGGATADDVGRVKAELRHAEKLHQNKPTFDISFLNQNKMTTQSTDQDGEGSEEEQEGEISSAGDEVAVTPSC